VDGKTSPPRLAGAALRNCDIPCSVLPWSSWSRSDLKPLNHRPPHKKEAGTWSAATILNAGRLRYRDSVRCVSEYGTSRSRSTVSRSPNRYALSLSNSEVEADVVLAALGTTQLNSSRSADARVASCRAEPVPNDCRATTQARQPRDASAMAAFISGQEFTVGQVFRRIRRRRGAGMYIGRLGASNWRTDATRAGSGNPRRAHAVARGCLAEPDCRAAACAYPEGGQSNSGIVNAHGVRINNRGSFSRYASLMHLPRGDPLLIVHYFVG
jgi:hypothetical protein